MQTQILAFIVWGTLALAVVGTYFFFLLSTRQPLEGEDYYRAVGKLRKPLLIAMLIVLSLTFGFTIGSLPYATSRDLPDRVIYVGVKQFSFLLSSQPLVSEVQMDTLGGELIEIPANSRVEFRVRSFDVNHGFGIFAPSGELVAQTQAMPGYVNRLIVTLPKEGTYSVLCLEYCGIAHHGMRASFNVFSPVTGSTQ
ncbi:MAG: hypothetical protein RMK00_04795 [Bacteroidota bacterium]|nr:hypothetical protein [Candidatus Kapabacteria bacterium]MDW8075070.1 hypothetical protein [Bacteroidota bacterium]